MMTGELELQNWLALGFVVLGVFVAVFWTGRAAERSLKQDRKNHPPAE